MKKTQEWNKAAQRIDSRCNRRDFITGAIAAGVAAAPLPVAASSVAHAEWKGGGNEAVVQSSTPEWIKKLQFQPPVRAGFTRVFDPSRGEKHAWYINDHCFIKDDSGTWHLFGITGREPAVPSHERFFLHATALQLMGPWEKHSPVMHVDAAAGETVMWAPYVLKHDDLYWMFYCGGGRSNTKYQMADHPIHSIGELLPWNLAAILHPESASAA